MIASVITSQNSMAKKKKKRKKKKKGILTILYEKLQHMSVE